MGASGCSTSARARATRRRCSPSSRTRSSRSSGCRSWPRGARDTLARTGYARVEVHVGDGTLGVPQRAPYDAIAVAAAAPEPPPALYGQLAVGGRLAVPVGSRRGQRLEIVTRELNGPAVVRSVPCRFVPLVGREGFAE